MLAHGFSIELLVERIRAGLASVKTERMRGRQTADHGCAHADH
jgi:hypothetical protein